MGARLVLSILSLGLAAALDAAGWEYSPMEWRGFYGTVVFAFVATLGYGFCLHRVKNVSRFAAINIATDIAIVSALVHLSGGSDSPFSFLYVLVAVYGAVLFRRTGAFVCAFASAASFGAVLICEQNGWIPSRAMGAVPGPAPVLIGIWLINAGGVVLVAALASLLSAELRQTGEALERRTSDLSRLQTLHERTVESLMSGLLTTDSNGRVTSFNSEAERITGQSRTEVHGCKISDVLPGIEELIAAAGGDGDPRHSRCRMPYQDWGGQAHHLGVGTYVLRDSESVADGYVVIFQDVTDIVEMETSLRRSERLAAIGELSASIAHEIRNPLASISGSIELLHSGRGRSGSEVDHEQLMRIVLREIDRLDHLIADFLHYARPGPLVAERISVGEVVRDVLKMFDVVRPDGIEAIVSISDDLFVFADSRQFQQVLWNLVLNACQAMPDGGRLEIAGQPLYGSDPQGVSPTGRIDGEQGEKSTWIEISVSDDGTGIAQDAMERIFDPFFTTKPSGSGLGLATVHRIVEDHKGIIRLESSMGAGTTVRVRLPSGEASA
jgi:two-component system sensor histidine kinase PilS (NtrC family)